MTAMQRYWRLEPRGKMQMRKRKRTDYLDKLRKEQTRVDASSEDVAKINSLLNDISRYLKKWKIVWK